MISKSKVMQYIYKRAMYLLKLHQLQSTCAQASKIKSIWYSVHSSLPLNVQCGKHFIIQIRVKYNNHMSPVDRFS